MSDNISNTAFFTKKVPINQFQDINSFCSIDLKKIAHVTQMLGAADKNKGYALPPELTASLIKMHKVKVDDENQIDVGSGVNLFQSAASVCGKPINFCLEVFDITDDEEVVQKRAVLSLREEAYEMGGLIAYTYLVPLAVYDTPDLENFIFDISKEFCIDLGAVHDKDENKWYDLFGEEIPPVTLESGVIDTAIKRKRASQRKLLEEQERLSRSAAARAQNFLAAQKNINIECALVNDELAELQQIGKRFVRRGKPDYHLAQVQMLDYVIEKNNLRDNNNIKPVVQIIEKYEKACEKIVKRGLQYELLTESLDISNPVMLGVNLADDISKIAVNKEKQSIKNTKRSEAYAATMQKISEPEREVIKQQKFNFANLLDKVLEKKTQGKSVSLRNGHASVRKANAREQFQREFSEKSKAVMEIYNSPEDIIAADGEFEKTEALNNIEIDTEVRLDSAEVGKTEITENIERDTKIIADKAKESLNKAEVSATDESKLQRLVKALLEQYKQSGKDVEKKSALAMEFKNLQSGQEK